MATSVNWSFKKDLDLVIFGATGFTGQRVVACLASQQAQAQSPLRWAVAGRNKRRLQSLIDSLTESELKAPECLVADVKNVASLDEMCKRSQLVLNCVGPYRFYGEQVVAACVRNKCDCLDLTGEPEFMELMNLKYYEQAHENGVFIISACGFDSIPAELGTVFTQKQFEGCGATCSSIDSFLTLKSGSSGIAAHYATYESAVHGFANVKALKSTRKKLKTVAWRTENGEPVKISRLGKRPKIFSGAHFSRLIERWCLPFTFADASVVRNTQTTLTALRLQAKRKPDVHPYYSAYITVPSKFILFLVIVFSLIFKILAGNRFGRWLLLTFPRIFSYGVFSHSGPSEKQLKETSFNMKFFGSGFSDPDRKEPDTKIVTSITGPEPGYVATPVFLVESALCLLQERTEILKEIRGGVFTPAVIFRYTSLIERLKCVGLKFCVEKSGNKS